MRSRSFSLSSLILSLSLAMPMALGCGDDDDDDAYCGDGIVQADDGEACDDGDDNGSDGRCGKDCQFNEGFCTVDSASVCASFECGEVQTDDSCGRMALASCGKCGDGKNCYKHKCVTGCSLPEEEEAAACEDACGIIQIEDACGKSASLDCGTDCGDGRSCDLVKHACVNDDICTVDEAPYCAISRCGAAKAIDSCGRSVLFDCTGTEGATVVNPLRDLTPLNGAYTGPSYLWDAEDTYRVGIVEDGSTFMYLLYKSDLKAGTTGTLSTVTTTASGNLVGCDTEFCAIIAHRSSSLDYWYDSVQGTATLVSLDPLTIQVKDAFFSDYVDAHYGRTCLTAPVSFTYTYGIVCEPDGLDDMSGQTFGTSSDGYGYQMKAEYTVGEESFEYDQVVYYYNTDEMYIYVDVNDSWAPSGGIETGKPIAIDTLGGFTDDGYPYCESQACLIVYADSQYNAYEGTITLTERDVEGNALAGTVENAVFFMPEVTVSDPLACVTPPVSFSFETSPGTYAGAQGTAVNYFRDESYTETWTEDCAAASPVIFPETSVSGTAERIATAAVNGFDEIQMLSGALGQTDGKLLLNLNTYYGERAPFAEGTLQPFEDFRLHPRASGWEVANGSAYCLDAVCIGYLSDSMLYSPVSGTMSVSSVSGRLTGSASDLVFTGIQADGETGEDAVCLFPAVSFSFDMAIQ